MRSLLAAAAFLLAACATVQPPGESELVPERERGERRWTAAEARGLVERDVAALLGAEALEEARRAGSPVMGRQPGAFPRLRSEEGRVGKEGRSRWAPYPSKKTPEAHRVRQRCRAVPLWLHRSPR